MYNLIAKNAASINNPDEDELTLFLDIADNRLKTKNENGLIEEVSTDSFETNKRIIAGRKITDNTYAVKFYDDITLPSKSNDHLNHIIKIEVYP